MPVTHDRDYYRALSSFELVDLARDEGINPELAIAAVERLAKACHGYQAAKRGFEFNNGGQTS